MEYSDEECIPFLEAERHIRDYLGDNEKTLLCEDYLELAVEEIDRLRDEIKRINGLRSMQR